MGKSAGYTYRCTCFGIHVHDRYAKNAGGYRLIKYDDLLPHQVLQLRFAYIAAIGFHLDMTNAVVFLVD